MSSLKLTSSVFLFIFAWIIFESYAVVPPLGDVNCKEGFCDSVTCSTSNCTLGKLMNDPSSVCGCCKICISYIGKKEQLFWLWFLHCMSKWVHLMIYSRRKRRLWNYIEYSRMWTWTFLYQRCHDFNLFMQKMWEWYTSRLNHDDE